MCFNFCFKPPCCGLNLCCCKPTPPPAPSYPYIYANSGVVRVAANTILPINQIAPSSSCFVLSEGKVTLPAGNYKVNYGFVGCVDAAGEMSVTLYSNDVALAGEAAVCYGGVVGQNYSGSRSSIISLSATSTVSLYNTTSQAVGFANAYLTITKLPC